MPHPLVRLDLTLRGRVILRRSRHDDAQVLGEVGQHAAARHRFDVDTRKYTDNAHVRLREEPAERILQPLRGLRRAATAGG